MNNIYPIVLKPTGVARGSHIAKGGRGGKNKKQGPSELVSFARICRLGGKALREDVVVALEGHRYEPDLAYVDTKRGIYLDIEIDEPYSTSGHPTHFVMADGVPKDGERNRRFQQAGWHVVRFSEEQIFCHTASCLKVIYTLLKELGAVDEIPRKVQDSPDLSPFPQWTEQQSLDMKKQHYRKSYLHFDPQRMNLADMAHAPRWAFYLATVYPQQPCAPNAVQDTVSTLLTITAQFRSLRTADTVPLNKILESKALVTICHKPPKNSNILPNICQNTWLIRFFSLFL